MKKCAGTFRALFFKLDDLVKMADVDSILAFVKKSASQAPFGELFKCWCSSFCSRTMFRRVLFGWGVVWYNMSHNMLLSGKMY